MESLHLSDEQQNLAHRVGERLRTGYEHVKRNLATYAALGASAATLAAVELVSPEPAQSSPAEQSAFGFKPGDYRGATSQVCTPEASAEGLCVEGEKIPVSFTVSGNRILNFHTAIIDTACYIGAGRVPNQSFPLDFKRIKLSEPREFSKAQLTNPGTEQRAAEGEVKGDKVIGDLGHAIFLNQFAEPDNDGDIFCQNEIVTWKAKLVQ